MPALLEVTEAVVPNDGSPTVYRIDIAQGSFRWSVRKRYSTLLIFHNALAELMPATALPPFPPKKMVRNRNSQFVEQRRLALNEYLGAVCRIPEVQELTLFRQFWLLDAKADAAWLQQYREASEECDRLAELLASVQRRVGEGGDLRMGGFNTILAALETFSAASTHLVETMPLRGIKELQCVAEERDEMMEVLSEKRECIVGCLQALVVASEERDKQDQPLVAADREVEAASRRLRLKKLSLATAPPAPSSQESGGDVLEPYSPGDAFEGHPPHTASRSPRVWKRPAANASDSGSAPRSRRVQSDALPPATSLFSTSPPMGSGAPDGVQGPPDEAAAARQAAAALARGKQAVEGNSTRTQRLHAMLVDGEGADSAELRSLMWWGVPSPLRAAAWRVALGYVPAHPRTWPAALRAQRCAYQAAVASEWFSCDGVDEDDETVAAKERKTLLERIRADVPRTHPNLPLFRNPAILRILERAVYMWAVHHPDLNYSQGMVGLAAPMLVVLLGAEAMVDDEAMAEYDLGPDAFDPATPADASLPAHVGEEGPVRLTRQALVEAEADTFGCLSLLLLKVQDNYGESRAGIHRLSSVVDEVLVSLDPRLHRHLSACTVDLIVAVFPWIVCVFANDLPMHCVLRLWDTLLAEEDLPHFLVYVCAAFLLRFSGELQRREHMGIMMYLKNAPAREWQEGDVASLMSDAWAARSLYPPTRDPAPSADV